MAIIITLAPFPAAVGVAACHHLMPAQPPTQFHSRCLAVTPGSKKRQQAEPSAAAERSRSNDEEEAESVGAR